MAPAVECGYGSEKEAGGDVNDQHATGYEFHDDTVHDMCSVIINTHKAGAPISKKIRDIDFLQLTWNDHTHFILTGNSAFLVRDDGHDPWLISQTVQQWEVTNIDTFMVIMPNGRMYTFNAESDPLFAPLRFTPLRGEGATLYMSRDRIITNGKTLGGM